MNIFDAISHESFMAFCNALADAANLTITEEWNESARHYDFTIVSGA